MSDAAAGFMHLARGAGLTAALLLTAACGRPPSTTDPRATPTPEPAARVTALADAYLAGYFEQFPEVVTINGVPGRRHDRVTDNSLPALGRWRRREDAWLREVREIDAATLVGRPEWATHAILRETLEASVAGRVCRRELWGIDQLNGWQTFFAHLATVQPVGTADRRAQALRRWRAIPRFLDNEVANLREGVRLGYTAPKGNVRLVLDQLDSLLATPGAKSPLYAPAARDSTPKFRAEMERIVAGRIHPAIRRYRDYLAGEYLPRARDVVAVAALPDGEACYRASVRGFTTLDVAPREVHELGLRQMAKIEAEMRAIARRSFGTADVRALLARLRTDLRYTFRTRAEVIAYSRAAVRRALAAMPRWFGLVPEADVVIEPYAAFRERSAPGEYWPPAEDGSRPGVFYISTYEPEKRSRAGPEATAFHETIPGHHLQVTIALKRKEGSHPLARYLFNSGYVEGWALYAERLADEMGLYSSDLDRLGMLSNQAWRAARLVVDPGLHVLGWSRQRAIDYMLARTTAAPAEAASEVDRYIVWPGQATAYMLGMLEIQRLRAEAERALGRGFDIDQFHDRVLEHGSLPLPALRQKVERWIAERR